jgi:hypothetical protein
VGPAPTYCSGLRIECYTGEPVVEQVKTMEVDILQEIAPGEHVDFISTFDGLTHAMVESFDVTVIY